MSAMRQHISKIIRCAAFTVAIVVAPECLAQEPLGDASLQQVLSFAEAGNLQAEIQAGKSYNYGTMGIQDYTKAYSWFSKAADQGSLEGKSWLASLYLYGHGTQRDTNIAFQMLSQTSAAGDATGTTLLGMAYESGFGVPKDISKAVSLYMQAIGENGGRACELLGTLYYRGEGVPKDLTKAAQLYTNSVALGDDWGQLRLGDFYATGTQYPKNAAMAEKLYMASAQQGNKVAEFRVAGNYERGDGGLSRDYQLAARYYYRSALRGYGPAQVALANLFWNGQGVGRDQVRAYVWSTLAYRQKIRGSGAQLAQMRRQMTTADLQQGDSYVSNLSSFFIHYKTL